MRLRVLLAEDQPVNQKVAVHMLENLGHEVLVVGDGAQALDALQIGRFDLVLMDIQMPEMDGFQAVAEIRRRDHQRGGRTRVIALTAYALKGDRERCAAAGFDGFLGKPLRTAELRRVLENLPREPVAPSEGPALDLEHLKKTCDGDHEFMGEIINSYLETSPLLLGRIVATLEAGDLKQAAAERTVGRASVWHWGSTNSPRGATKSKPLEKRKTSAGPALHLLRCARTGSKSRTRSRTT